MLAGHVLGGWMMARAALASLKPELVQEPIAQKKRQAALLYGETVLMPALGLAYQVTSGQSAVKHALGAA